MRHLIAALFKRLGSQRRELARLRADNAEAHGTIRELYRAQQMWKARALAAERRAHPSQRGITVGEADRLLREIRNLPEVDQ